jgi:acyl dehydratase
MGVRQTLASAQGRKIAYQLRKSHSETVMNLEALRNLSLPPVEQAYGARDAILYALGIGFGERPLDPAHLLFTYEANLQVVPSMSVVLSHPGFWLRDPALGVDWLRMLHGEQDFRMHAAIPPAGTVVATYRVTCIEDKGVERGAVLHFEKLLTDKASGMRLATVRQVVVLRGDGGQGGFGEPPPPAEALPAGEPSDVVEIATLPQSALIYRLSGDLNPIHADPAAAEKAGFRRPILHGLCSMGVATRALIERFCPDEPARLSSLFVRFSRPVYPGDTLRFEMQRDGSVVTFRAVVPERSEIVLDRARAVLDGPLPVGAG